MTRIDWSSFRCALCTLTCAIAMTLTGCGGGSSNTNITPTPPPAPGTLDTGFGSGGIVTTSISGSARADAVVVQSDGKILVAGSGSVGGGSRQVLLVRYQSDGALDAGFGTGGMVLSSPSAGDNEAVAVALQPDGKILVLAQGPVTTLIRYTSSGSVDGSFGVGGVVYGPAEAPDTSVNGVEVQPDGKIVLAIATTTQIGAARVNADGAPDTSFGTGGEALVPLAPLVCCTHGAPSIVVKPDGGILIGGSHEVPIFGGTLQYSSLVQLTPTGALDSAFGQGGYDKGSLQEGLAEILLQSDGKILAEVTGGEAAGPLRNLSRLLPDGTLDPTFGTGGTASGIGGLLALQPNGKIVAAETATVGTSPNSRVAFKLSRYGADGGLDLSFGNAGSVITTIEANNAVGGLAIQPDGRIVVAGYETAVADSSFPPSAIVNIAVARYLGDPPGTP